MQPLGDRRAFINPSVAALAFTMTAGCLGDSEEPGHDNMGGDDPGDDGPGDDEPATNRETWLENCPNYSDVEDFTGEAELLVECGLTEEYDTFVVEPPAIRVDSGTTAVRGCVDDKSHSVTHETGEFDSGIMDGQGETFEFTFDETGTFLYYCEPHREIGQNEEVIVE